jgi:hypothetical protein
VPYDPRLPVYSFWDLGVGDATAIWFIQLHRREVRAIDYYENEGEGLTHYISVLKNKKYVYEEHFAPHDIEVREFSTGVSRKETAGNLGIHFTTVPKIGFEEGVDAVREIIPITYFDSVRCEEGVNALMHYRKRYNDKSASYSARPEHDWSSHGADAFRYMALSVENIMDYAAYKTDNVRVLRSIQPRVNRAIGGQTLHPSSQNIKWINGTRISTDGEYRA